MNTTTRTNAEQLINFAAAVHAQAGVPEADGEVAAVNRNAQHHRCRSRA